MPSSVLLVKDVVVLGWDNLGVMLIADAGVRAARRAQETDDTPSSLIVRLAADGFWLSKLAGNPGISQAMRKQMISRLLEMARDGEG